MNKNKTEQILFATKKIEEILEHVRPNNGWEIAYDIPEHVSLTDWDRHYLNLINGDEYFFIYVNSELLYAVNVTGDSVLTAIYELIDKLAKKF